MEFLSNYKQNRKAALCKAIEQEAEDSYTLMEFNNQLYYAFNGVPMVGIAPDTTANEILQKWQGFKRSYIDYKKSVEHYTVGALDNLNQ